MAVSFFVGMWRAGVGGRAFAGKAAAIHNVRKERDTYTIWRQSGVKGRAIVHFGKHMPVAKTNEDLLKRLSKKAVSEPGAKALKGLDNDNYLYAAMRANYIRKILGVIPDREWPKVKAKLESGTLFKVHDDFARTWMDGLPLRVGTLAALPPTRLSNFG